VQDITQASFVQLARLTAEILRLHLASRHLSTTGMKATMAQQLYNAIHALDTPTQQHSVDSSVSQLQQDITVTLRHQSDDPVRSQQQGTQQQQGTLQQQGMQQQQGTQQQDTQQLRKANPTVTLLLQQHTNVTPAIAPTASTELPRFIHQAIPSQAVPPTGQPPASLSPACHTAHGSASNPHVQ